MAVVLKFEQVKSFDRKPESVQARWTRCTVCNHRWPAVEPLTRNHTQCPQEDCGALCFLGNDEGRP